MTLRVWIKKTGIHKVSKLLDVSRPRVRHWANGNALPHPTQMIEIVKKSKGVTYKAMITDYVRHQAKNK